MSIESAKALYSRLLTDKSFRTQVELAASEEQRRQILQAAGYDYTPEELETAKTELLESTAANEELSDAELESVTGGTNNPISIRDLIKFPMPIALYGISPMDWK